MTSSLNPSINSFGNGNCMWCGNGVQHMGKCPLVKAFEYDNYGMIRRVEFHDNRPAVSTGSTGGAGPLGDIVFISAEGR